MKRTGLLFIRIGTVCQFLFQKNTLTSKRDTLSHSWNIEKSVLNLIRWKFSMKQRHITALLNIKGNCLMWANWKIVQNTFDSWKCQLLCNKMSKVEHSYKPRLKTILKQHHFNVNRAQMNKYSSRQILISVHIDRFAYMQICICKLVSTRCKFQEFAYGANFTFVCKFIHMDRFAHTSIFAYMEIFAHVCKSVHVKAA